MHPVIRLVNFSILSVFLALGAWPQLFLGALIVAPLLLRGDRGAWTAIAPMMRRMRWLWLSLTIVYVWFTPGDPVMPVDGAWVPTIEGIYLAALRVASLALIVIAAGLLLHVTTREQLFGALHWLAGPLAGLGVARERIAVRMALSLAAVAEVQTLVREAAARADPLQMAWVRWSNIAAILFRTVISKAEAAPCIELSLPPHNAPPRWQWGLPVLLSVLMVVVAWMHDAV